MGFFSWKCRLCDDDIMNLYELPKHLKWMNDVTVVHKKTGNRESVQQGCYDGYGKIPFCDMVGVSETATFYHTKCWANSKEPGYKRGRNKNAPSQGYFPWWRNNGKLKKQIIEALTTQQKEKA